MQREIHSRAWPPDVGDWATSLDWEKLAQNLSIKLGLQATSCSNHVRHPIYCCQSSSWLSSGCSRSLAVSPAVQLSLASSWPYVWPSGRANAARRPASFVCMAAGGRLTGAQRAASGECSQECSENSSKAKHKSESESERDPNRTT